MKRMLSFLLALLLFLVSVPWLNEVVIDKENNRYYMLRRELQRLDEQYPLQIYGSCHAYTSYNPELIRQNYGISSYVMANPGEIIPVTYLQMHERFQKDVPKVALVEVWGMNAYETYTPTSEILQSYLPVNIEEIPVSKEKNDVIRSFDTLDVWNENLRLAKYKSRILGMQFSKVDFNYSFEAANAQYNPDGNAAFYEEMANRFNHYGYKKLPPVVLKDYDERQANIPDNASCELESVMVKYFDKIIELCDSYGVKLIFYRAPYVSTENELKKVHFLKDYLERREIPFYDLEEEIKFDYNADFNDYEHLSEHGAYKVTTFLNERVLEYLS